MASGRRSRANSSNVMPPVAESDNPSNWTVTVLKKKLADMGIVINAQLSHSVLKRIYLDNVDNGVSVREGTTATPSDSTTVPPVRAVQSTDLPVSNAAGSSNLPYSSGSLVQMPGASPENLRQSGFAQTLVSPMSTTMADNVLVSTLQLCQQALTTLGQSVNKTDVNQFNLSTAMVSPGAGTPASQLSEVDLVSPDIRADIIAGKDVNLNVLLIPNYTTPSHKKIRENDERLVRNLTLDEFIIAFGRYKRIMCNAYPNRMDELDAYLSHIIETANIWPERFYEYHQVFSNKCAALLLQRNIKVDWSKGDNELRMLISAGSPVKSCDFCGSNIHSSSMCAQKYFRKNLNSRPSMANRSSRQAVDMHGRDVKFHDGEQICNNFNTSKGCSKPYCKYLHICKSCKSNHPKIECNQTKTDAKTKVASNPSPSQK